MADCEMITAADACVVMLFLDCFFVGHLPAECDAFVFFIRLTLVTWRSLVRLYVRVTQDRINLFSSMPRFHVNSTYLLLGGFIQLQKLVWGFK